MGRDPSSQITGGVLHLVCGSSGCGVRVAWKGKDGVALLSRPSCLYCTKILHSMLVNVITINQMDVLRL